MNTYICISLEEITEINHQRNGYDADRYVDLIQLYSLRDDF